MADLEIDHYAVIDKYRVQCEKLADKTEEVYKKFFEPFGLSDGDIQILLGFVAFCVLEKSRGWGGIQDGSRKNQRDSDQDSRPQGEEEAAG